MMSDMTGIFHLHAVLLDLSLGRRCSVKLVPPDFFLFLSIVKLYFEGPT